MNKPMYAIWDEHFVRGFVTGITRNHITVRPELDDATLKYTSERAANAALKKHGWAPANFTVIEIAPESAR